MGSISSQVQRFSLLWHAFGLRGLGERALFLAVLRTRLVKHWLPAASSYRGNKRITWTFRFDLVAIRQRVEGKPNIALLRKEAIDKADRVIAGWLRFYGGAERKVGWPPEWHALSLVAGVDASAHWTDISDDLGSIDIKDIWEPSRFGFTFMLARAYLFTGDDRYADEWWNAFEDWCRANPPNTGPNWRCGQESSLRAIAVCFALSTFTDSPASTPEREQLALRFLGATHRRVRATLAYALSQRNNHAISELVFLLSLPKQQLRLERILRRTLRDQWYPDGSYSQQSLNYQRLAVHALAWLLHTQPLLQDRTAREIRRCLSLSAVFLSRCADPVAGRWPNSGANDGSLLFDLNNAERWDSRPTLAMLGRPHLSTAFTELAAWFPPERLQLPGVAPGGDTTFISLRGPRSLAFTHIGSSRHRQGHDDQQSLEIIFDGEPIILDPGTFRYSGEPLWRSCFMSASAHSGLMAGSPTSSAMAMDSLSIGRFLNAGMPVARAVRYQIGDREVLSSVRRDKGVDLQRTIERQGDTYRIVDQAGANCLTVRWILPSDVDVSLNPNGLTARNCTALVQVTTTGLIRIERRSSDDPLSGWWSPIYGEREPAIAVLVEGDHTDVVTTLVSPVDTRLSDGAVASTDVSGVSGTNT